MPARRIASMVVVAAVAIGVGYAAWHAYFRGDAAIIRERIDALAAEMNEGAADGVGLIARAAKIGSFFTEDVVVDLGAGSAPIHGRETVMGMTARLQPRTSAFTVAVDDVTVELTGGEGAEVSLTATFTRRSTAETSIDARELNLGMRKVNGEWLIARATVVEPLNKR